MKLQGKEGERTLVLTVTPGYHKSAKSTREFSEPGRKGLDEDYAAASHKQSGPLIRFIVPHNQANHPKRLEDGARKETPRISEEEMKCSWRYKMSYHERDERIFRLLEENIEEREAEQSGDKIEQEQLIITMQRWRFSSTGKNIIVGYVFNHPRRGEDKYKDGTLVRFPLDPEYDISYLQEGSLALTRKTCRGHSVIRLGAGHEPKPRRKESESQQEWQDNVLPWRIEEKICLGGEDHQIPHHWILTIFLELRELQ